MPKNVLTIFEKPIFMSFEPLDPQIFATGVGATTGINLTVLLRGDGVYYGIKDQSVKDIKVAGVPPVSEIAGTPPHVWTWIVKQTGNKVLAVKEDMEKRGVTKEELTEGIGIVGAGEVPALLQQNDVIFVY